MAVLWSVGGGFGASLVLLPLLIARWAYSQYAGQQKAYEATIRALVQAVETKDHYTRGHSERVAAGCVRIATTRGMTADRVSALRYAGILHDVGKLSVTTRLLQKTAPLTDREYEEIKMHPVTGREMLRGIEFLEEAYEGILHHHERLDGLGYPMGLKGAEIPEFARVIAVADAFDSMTSTRSYRNARSVAEAVAELERCRGTQFDPEMVEAMIHSLRQEPWRTTATAVAPDEDVAVNSAVVDHDDPTAPLPLGTDETLRAAAEAAEATDDSPQLAALRWQDDA
jgi:HD-GYP domain-containing protein (c-di-GMP phosphodiesterase class II)